MNLIFKVKAGILLPALFYMEGIMKRKEKERIARENAKIIADKMSNLLNNWAEPIDQVKGVIIMDRALKDIHIGTRRANDYVTRNEYTMRAVPTDIALKIVNFLIELSKEGFISYIKVD